MENKEKMYTRKEVLDLLQTQGNKYAKALKQEREEAAELRRQLDENFRTFLEVVHEEVMNLYDFEFEDIIEVRSSSD